MLGSAYELYQAGHLSIAILVTGTPRRILMLRSVACDPAQSVTKRAPQPFVVRMFMNRSGATSSRQLARRV